MIGKVNAPSVGDPVALDWTLRQGGAYEPWISMPQSIYNGDAARGTDNFYGVVYQSSAYKIAAVPATPSWLDTSKDGTLTASPITSDNNFKVTPATYETSWWYQTAMTLPTTGISQVVGTGLISGANVPHSISFSTSASSGSQTVVVKLIRCSRGDYNDIKLPLTTMLDKLTTIAVATGTGAPVTYTYNQQCFPSSGWRTGGPNGYHGYCLFYSAIPICIPIKSNTRYTISVTSAVGQAQSDVFCGFFIPKD
jgi:hypothetical protein